MKTVEDDTGRRYVVTKEASESSRVLDVATGDERYVENDRLTTLDTRAPLETVAETLPPAARTLITAIHDDRSLGLLIYLDTQSPVSVRTILEQTTFCESDVHGRLGEFHAAGLVDETTVGGERAYTATDTTRDVLEALNSLHDARTE